MRFFCPSLNHQEGLGIGENGEEIPLSEINIKDVQNAKEAKREIELRAFYIFLMGYPPVNSNNAATIELVAGEIIEFLESDGDRFFQNKDDAWLFEQLGRIGKKPSRRTLIRELRKERGYTHCNWLDARRDGDVVSICCVHFSMTSLLVSRYI